MNGGVECESVECESVVDLVEFLDISFKKKSKWVQAHLIVLGCTFAYASRDPEWVQLVREPCQMMDGHGKYQITPFFDIPFF